MSSRLQNEAVSDNSNVSLEDRLRGLILNNRQPAPSATQGPSRPADALVPPPIAATADLQRGEFRRQLTSDPSCGALPPSQSPHSSRKKLNQAQRRQMSAQISVPIDPRPVPQRAQRGRGFSPSTGFAWQPHPSGSSIRQQVETYRPPHQDRTSARGPPRMSFHSLQLHGQHQYEDPFMNHTHIMPQQGDVQQFPTALTGAQQTNSFHPPRAHEHLYILAPDNEVVPRAPQYNRLYQPGPYGGNGYNTPSTVSSEQIAAQSAFLDALFDQYVSKISIGQDEIQEKERFRAMAEQICREVIANYETIANESPNFNSTSVELKCFGSMASGFATKASDMDLALLTPHSNPSPDSPDSPIPRLLEKKLLDMGFGARLLTRTRVPIIKLCQRPTEKLMYDLQEERKKWEDGFFTVESIEGEPAPEDIDTKFDFCEKSGKDTMVEENTKSPTVTYQERLASLHQKPKESLMDYYGRANRLLRKLGSCDLDISYENSSEQIEITRDVCRAFVNGLSDADLRACLSKYRSLSFSDIAEPTNRRSLRGVFTQIEGEQLAIAWDNRPLREATDRMEADGQHQIDDWRKLLNRTDLALKTYNRMLNQAVSRLKKIPSLQLVFLEQGQHESPQQYYLRAATILKSLRSQSDDHVQAVAITHYMNGIRDPQIQEALQPMTSSNELVSLSAIALQHRVIQLAYDYEIALSKNLYAERDRADIQRYIDFLRSRDVDYASQLAGGASMHANIDKSIADLITKVRGLENPSNLLNKPRDRYKDHLEFPKTDIGIQCDINFSAQLGLHNTLLLRCYSLTDSRVRPFVLFIKYWARVRAINTPYRGSLSSYGYVLMVLHYLVNVASPFVCPNLQLLPGSPPQYFPPDEIFSQTTCNGYDVRFWRNEKEIASLAERGMLNFNRDSLGKLLRGFFEYYAQSGPLSTGGRGFDWGRDVLSLRTQGGLLTKQHKGWVGARTVTETRTEAAPISTSTLEPPSTEISDNAQAMATLGSPRRSLKEEVKEIRHRFLFAIEDPFELDHNVARTVTHDGIVAIRDEFRRAWRIINSVGKNEIQEGLLDEVIAGAHPGNEFDELMELLHGKVEDTKRA